MKPRSLPFGECHSVQNFYDHRVVLLDERVPHPAQLLAGCVAGTRPHIVRQDQDGLWLILRELCFAEGPVQLHLVAHGQPGRLALGHDALDCLQLLARADEIATVAGRIHPASELLLYGCESGAGEQGREFVESLSLSLGGIRVAAASGLVGHASLGGNWRLDVRSAAMDPRLFVTPATQSAWAGLLQDKLYEETRVNSFTDDQQFSPSVATLADGSYVITWVSRYQDDGSAYGVYAQRFTAAGVPLGVEFQVNTTEAGNQSEPRVAGLSDGGFAIVWTDSAADSSNDGVFLQRYDASGFAQGGEVQVNTSTTSYQNTPSISAYNGGFVVTWTSYDSGGSNSYDIFSQRFDNAGSPQGGETLVNTVVSGTQNQSHVDARADGSYVVVWTDQGGSDGGGYGVYGQRFDTSGSALGAAFLVNTTTTDNQYEPKIAQLTGGGFVVVWRSQNQDGSSAGVYGQLYDASGNAAGGEFLVNQSTPGGQYQPDVVGLENGGFVVTWYNDNYDITASGSYGDVYVREYDSAGAAQGNEVKVNTPLPYQSYQYEPAIAHLGSDNYVVVYRADSNQDGSQSGIYQQLFGDAAELPRQASPQVNDFTGSVEFFENAVNAVPQIIDYAVSVEDADSTDFDGGSVMLYYARYGSADDQLGVRNQGTAPGQIGVSGNSITFNDGTGAAVIGTIDAAANGVNGAALTIGLNANATADAVEALIQSLTYASTSNSPAPTRTVGLRLFDGDGGASDAGQVVINVSRELDGTPAAWGEEQVNTYTPGQQQYPHADGLLDGGYVVTWISYDQEEGDTSAGVFAQRFNASGVAVGPEIQVNTLVNGEQSWPHVAGLSDGGFVITWQDNGGYDGSGWGVFGQRYNANGLEVGTQFQLNSHYSNSQYHDAVAAYNGGFATIWASTTNPGGDNYDIYLQRWANDGSPVGGEMLVSTNVGSVDAQSGAQYVPDIAAYDNGDLVIVWHDASGSDGSGYGVFGRLYDAGTGTFSATFLVNTTTAGNQSSYNGDYVPKVALLDGGGFVVAWPSDNNDGSGWGIVAQRFDSDGNKVGGEILVNEYTYSTQYSLDVLGLPSGGFVVSFSNASTGPEGTSDDVTIREFDADGNSIDGDRRANTYTNSTQYQPTLVDLQNGNYAAVWASNGQDGSNYGIYQQLFGDEGELLRQANPELGDFIGTASFQENQVNAGLQVIDASVELLDADSPDFDGGRLDLYYLKGGDVEDQLGVVHQGFALGQIGVSGNTISYGGETIGTLSGGSNGENLRIDFTSSAASVQAVEALVQRLGYANSSSSPDASRTVAVRVSDGDGGSSKPGIVTINVEQALDGTSPVYQATQVNTYFRDAQQWPAAATLNDGSYVITWISQYQDGDGWGVYAQRYSSEGVAVGPEWQVNALTNGEQSWPHISALSDGGFVITWQDSGGNDGSGWGVFGQRYAADGSPAGGQFQANTHTSSTQYHDAVSGYTGGFSTVWSSSGNAGNDNYDIFLQRWNNDGTPDGGELRVSTVPGSSASQTGAQHVPSIATLGSGSQVIVWSDTGGNDGDVYGVFGRLFDPASGTFGDTFLVNTTTDGRQSYGSDGNYAPSVSALADGGFVVVWPSNNNDGAGWGIVGQRYDASGTAVDGEFLVNDYAPNNQFQAQVLGLSGGGFVVAFYNSGYGESGSYRDIYVREFDAAGQPIDGDRKVNVDNGANNYQQTPTLVDLGNGNFSVIWSSEPEDGSGYGIYQQLFGDTAELPRQADPVVEDFAGTVVFDENLVNSGLQLIDTAVGLSDPDSGNFNGGRLDLYFIKGAQSQDGLGVVHEGNGPGQIGVSGATVSYQGVPFGVVSGGANGANLRIDFNSNAATVQAVEALIEQLGYQNSDSSPSPSRELALRVSDGDGGASEPGIISVQITPVADGTLKAWGEAQVNTFSSGDQNVPEVATLSGGGYVVTWSSANQDGSGYGVYAQQFSASGVALGPEFRVNDSVAGDQLHSHVSGLSDGGFVITWDDRNSTHDGSGYGVYGQRFDASGTPMGSEFALHTHTSNYQYNTSVAAYNGGFATVWNSFGNPGGNGYDIYLQRWNNDGTKNGAETLVSTVASPGSSDAQAGYQYVPDVAAYANGDLVIVWSDDAGNDGDQEGVYLRLYDAGTGTFGDTMLVNTATAGRQSAGDNIDYTPSVALLSDGGFVVVWNDNGADGSGWATLAQRFDAAGNKLGGEILVNEYTNSSQYQPDVTGLSTGGFVVSFYHDNLGPDGTYYDAYVREFDTSGNPVDGDVRINTYNGSNQVQFRPSLADLGNGNYVSVWASQNQDGSSYGIYQQLFGDEVELARQDDPVLDDLATQRILVHDNGSVFYAGNPQLIDPDVAIADPDSADFNGGSLIAYFLDGAAGTHVDENLGIQHAGTGPGQVGISGSDVTYEGTVIGNFSGGAAGQQLTISLNGSADADAVQALVEALTYQHTNPGTSDSDRYLGVRLFDGDGGASQPAAVQVHIQASYSPATLELLDVEPAVTLAESDAQAGAILDAGVGLQYQGSTGFDAGSLTVSYVGSSNRVDDQLYINHEGVGVGQVGVSGSTISFGGVAIGSVDAGDDGSNGSPLTITFNASADAIGIERVIENLAYQTASDGPNASRTIQLVVRDGDGVASAARQMQIDITPELDGAEPLFGEQSVNTYQPGNQVNPAITSLQGSNAGSYVIVWNSQNGQDGSADGIFAQRYDTDGAAVGNEFQVTSHTVNQQFQPHAASLANGGFVVTWTSNNQDSSSYGVYAQMYDAAGQKVGNEFRVNDTTVANQYEPAVVGLSDGSFVVAYRSEYTDGSGYVYDVLGKRYAADGTELLSEFTLNTTVASTQGNPRLAALPGGQFVSLYWDAGGGDTSGYGVFSRVFNADGSEAVAEQLVNTTVTGNQYGQDVAALSGGGYVAAWWSASGSVFGQRYDASGNPVGGEFEVSTQDTDPYNAVVRIAALDNGGFVVAWDSYNGPGGLYEDIFIQQYDASGNEVDGPVRVNSSTNNTESFADIAGLAGGAFVVTWQGYNHETGVSNTYGVFSQLFGAPGSITRSADPELVDVNASVTFAEDLVNATPQLLDTAVKLADADSSIFDGGQLTVSIVPAGQNQYDSPFLQDQLGVRNQGTGAGQVGVSGSSITYEGTVIGNLSSDGANGNNLVIDFNANATVQAAEAVIENLTYANTETDPAVSRLVSIRVTDGAGGASAPVTIQVNVTPDTDGTVALFDERQVNTYEANEQIVPVVTGLLGSNLGQHVVVWRSYTQDGDGYSVHGQRYDAQGGAVGAEFQVNTQTLGQQYEPAVAALANGGFVAVWRSDGQDGSGAGVYAQVFGADGAPSGAEFRVNTSTTSNQYEPSVIGLSDGSFVVAYRSDYTDGSGYVYDVLGRRFDASGNELVAEFTLNTTSASTQSAPSLAALAGGGFVATYRDHGGADGSSDGVFSRVFNADGSEAVAEQVLSTTVTGSQYGQDVVGLAGGGYVAAWWTAAGEIHAQRFDAAGAKDGGEFRVSTLETAPSYGWAKVAALGNGGFVVAWTSGNGPGGSADDVFVQEYDVLGNAVDGPKLANQNVASTQYYPDIAGLAANNYVVTWAGYNQESATANTYGIFSRLFGDEGAITRSEDPDLRDVAASVTFAENTVNASAQLIDPAVNLTDVDSSVLDGGQLVVSVVSGYGNISQAQLPQVANEQDQFGIRNQGNSAGEVGVSGTTVTYGGTAIGTIDSDGSNGNDLVVTFNSNASVAAVEAVIENLTYQNTVSNPVASRLVSIQVSDGAGGSSQPDVIQVNVTPEYDGAQPLFDEIVVNTYTPGTQDQPAMARLADGGYVTVWTSADQDGWGKGVYGQRFDAQGVPVGNQFQVNDYTPYDQYEPAVADLSDGGFVVVWRSQYQDGSSAGVYAQRYDSNSIQVGDAFLVNSQVSGGQYQATVESFPGGGYVVAWYSDAYQDARYYDVFFQRFANDGTPLGAETRANTSTGFENQYQSQPEVTVLGDSTFVVAWTSNTEDGSGNGIFLQRFDASGVALGSEFQVNTYTANQQEAPSVTALAGGGYVVVWQSVYQDNASSWGVFGQRFADDGTPLGNEFRINTSTSNNEDQPDVSALDNGGFVVTWRSGSVIHMQQFDASGIPVDGETRVDVVNNSYAAEPVVEGLSNGNFVISWTDSPDSASGGYGISQRLFGDPADFNRQANPELVDVDASVNFDENDVNLVPQVIDPGVGLVDADSPDFNGGLLEVDYISGYGGQNQLGFEGLENQDQLGIRNEGNGPLQVGVSGTNVFFGGSLIGTILANGANHGKLMVQFNANASVDAVESVIENLTYQNTSSNPFASRTVSIRVTDGDGGASDARFVALNVTPEVDGAVPDGPERQVNTTVANNQEDPAVARLDDGGYVVVWRSQNQDGSSYGVFGQRYDADDNPVGAEFLVNTTTSQAQQEARVAGLDNGGFVVAWRSENQDGSSAGVYMQRYNADGSTAGGETLVNTTTTGGQYQPDITALPAGGYVVAWYDDSNHGGEYYDVYFQRYDSSGNALGGEVRANAPIPGSPYDAQSQPAISWLSDGGFVVVWTDSSGNDGDNYGVFGQRFAADGSTVGNEFRVNTHVSSTQQAPHVAALADGGFVAVWQSEGQDLSSTGVYAQRYASDGTTVGTEFRVNTTTSSTQLEPQVAGLENGGWVVTWTDRYGAASDTYDVFMQQYDSAGRQVDGQTQVNTYQRYVQDQPVVTSMPDGGFVIAYRSYGYTSDGGNDTYEIQLQRYSNTAPQLTDVTVNAVEDVPEVLTDELFISGYFDSEGQNLSAVKIITLPAYGALTLNGTPVIPGQEISLAELQANQLVYLGDPDYFGSDEFRWTGSDGISFAATPVATLINVANVNDGPRLEAGADDTAAEGNHFSHAVIIGDPDPDTVQVTVDWGDGSSNSVYNTTAGTLNIGHYYTDDGVYTVSVTANDQQGQVNSIETDGFNVTVSNVAPFLYLYGNATVEQDQVYTLTLGGVIDPGDDTVTEYQVDWGDGSALEVIAAASLPANREIPHTYTSPGARTISINLVDEDGTFTAVQTKGITVSPPAEVLALDAGPDRTVNEGTYFVQAISFTDPTDAGPVGRLYTIDWGDGIVDSGRTYATGSFNLGHTYADGAASYTVNVTLDDDGAQSDSDSFNATVDNVAPTLFLGGAASIAEGSIYTLTINASDPGNDTITTYRVSWGDGSAVETISAVDLAAAGNQLTHLYTDGLLSTSIVVEADDEDGTWSNSKPLTVSNVAPTIALSGASQIDEGSVYTLTLGAVTDPGVDAAFEYIINWGDGNADTVTALGDYTHTYADGQATRNISVSVRDEDGTHANAGTKVVTVNNVAPTAPVTGAATVDEGTTFSLSVGAVVDPGVDTISGYSIDWGDGTAVETFTPAQWTAAAGSFSHTYTDGDSTPTITVSASDEDGTFVLGTHALTVNDVDPTISLGGDATVDEGSLYTLALGAVSDPGDDTVTEYRVDWGDGSSDTYASAGEVTHTYADGDNNYTISVDLVDEDGVHVAAGTKVLTVNNVAPMAPLNGGSTVDAGVAYTLNIGAITDPGADTVTAYQVDWGDGSSDTYTAAQLAGMAGNVMHTYALADVGAQTISVQATDEDGTHLLGTVPITVTSPAPEVSIIDGGPGSVDEGSLFSRTVAFTDANDTDGDGWTYAVDWGNDGSFEDSGSVAPGGAKEFLISRAFSDGPDTQTVAIRVTDGVGESDTKTFELTVNNVAPTAPVTGAATVDEGSAFSLSVGAVVDPGVDTISAYSIDWGDGTAVETFTPAQWTAAAGSFSHTYADGDSTPTITVSASDEDGTFVLGTHALTVNDVDPTISLGGDATVDEGSLYTLTLGAVSDPGDDTVTEYRVDWGDGSSDTYASAGDVTHTYADGGNNYTISVDLVDEDGVHVAAATKVLMVNNVAPTAPVTGAAAVDEGSAFSLSVGAVVDPGVDTISAYSIDWGDGTAVETFTPAQWTAAAGSFSHTYADGDSTPTITVSASDDDGTFVLGTHVLTVDNVAPMVNAGADVSITSGDTFTGVGSFTDPGSDTWTATVDYGDGSGSQVLPLKPGGVFDLNHLYSTPGTYTVTVSVSDDDGDVGTDALVVTVGAVASGVNVAPLSNEVLNEGDTLSKTVVFSDGEDADLDGWTFAIDWDDDGTVDETGSIAPGASTFNISQSYPDGASTSVVAVTVTDKAGDSDTEKFNVAVNNVDPTIDSLALDATAIDEGDQVILTISASDPAGTNDPLEYQIDWGDGNVDTVAAASLVGGQIAHVYADDEDGPVNATAYTIAVTASDGDGGSASASTSLTVNNVAPRLSLSGDADVAEDVPYTLTLANLVDPGDDPGKQYAIDWGDGTTDNVSTLGDFVHTYVDDGNYTISIDITDDDGTFEDVATLDLRVNDVLRIGDAPERQYRSTPTAWEDAWTSNAVAISHKADLGDSAEAWSTITWNSRSATVIAGGDVLTGDLGVSGQTVASGYAQEIDGTEGLRFDLLGDAATRVNIDLNRLYANDADLNFEAGRLQAFDAQGGLVGEVTFEAAASGHQQQATFEASSGFSSIVVSAGAYDGNVFVFGGYTDGSGNFTTAPYVDTEQRGSDFMLEAVEFEFGPVQTAPIPPSLLISAATDAAPVEDFALLDPDALFDANDLVIGFDPDDADLI